MKSRLLRIALIVLVVLAFVGWFTFSTFFFPPLEKGLETDVAGLVPRRVDFFVAKAGLGEDFDGFPHLAHEQELARSPAGQLLAQTELWAKLQEQLGLQRAVAEMEAAVAQLPLGLEPLDVAGGRDLAFAGTFAGPGLQSADWAAYATLGFTGKLAFSALRYPGLIGLEKQGLQADVQDDWVRLSGGQLPRPLFLTRLRDVGIVATSEQWIREAKELELKSFQDSLAQSAPYFDHVENAPRVAERDEIEIALDVRALLESQRISGALPDSKSQEPLEALLGKYFQLGAVRALQGVVGFDDGLRADLHLELSSEVLTPVQTRFLRTRGFDRASLLGEAAQLAPADTCFFLHLRGDLGDLMRQIVLSLEPALRDLLEDAFRNTGRYGTLDQLVGELDASLKDRLVLVARPNDYPPDPSGPPHNDEPVFAVALALWTSNVEKVNEVRELIGNNGPRFGLKGRNPGDAGYFRNVVEGGFEVREFWSELIPGTGVIATVNAGDLTIVANSFQMLGHILKTWTQGGARYPRLSEDGRFLAALNSSLSSGNVALWVAPRSAADTLRAQVRAHAKDAIRIDWKAERARLEERFLRERWPGERRGALTPERQAELDALVTPELEALRTRIQAEQVPAIVQEAERWIAIAGSVPGALAVLALDPKSADLSLRVPVDLEPSQP